MLPQMREIEAIRRDMREKMARDGISARKVMRDAGISHVTVNKFLKGKGDTHDQTVIKLCLYLSLDWYEREKPEEATP